MVASIDLRVYSEVYDVLQKMGNEYIEKIPKELYKLIYEKSLLYKGCKTGNLSQKSVDFIAFLHYKYWTNSQEEKQELYDIFKENEKFKNEELKEKYELAFNNGKNLIKLENAENSMLEKQSIENIGDIENHQIAEIQNEKWYIKIFNKIRSLFRKTKKN